MSSKHDDPVQMPYSVVSDQGLPATMAQSDACPTGDQEIGGLTPAGSATFFRGDMIMKYFLQSFSPFRWLEKGTFSFWQKNVHNTS